MSDNGRLESLQKELADVKLKQQQGQGKLLQILAILIGFFCLAISLRAILTWDLAFEVFVAFAVGLGALYYTFRLYTRERSTALTIKNLEEEIERLQ